MVKSGQISRMEGKMGKIPKSLAAQQHAGNLTRCIDADVQVAGSNNNSL